MSVRVDPGPVVQLAAPVIADITFDPRGSNLGVGSAPDPSQHATDVVVQRPFWIGGRRFVSVSGTTDTSHAMRFRTWEVTATGVPTPSEVGYVDAASSTFGGWRDGLVVQVDGSYVVARGGAWTRWDAAGAVLHTESIVVGTTGGGGDISATDGALVAAPHGSNTFAWGATTFVADGSDWRLLLRLGYVESGVTVATIDPGLPDSFLVSSGLAGGTVWGCDCGDRTVFVVWWGLQWWFLALDNATHAVLTSQLLFSIPDPTPFTGHTNLSDLAHALLPTRGTHDTISIPFAENHPETRPGAVNLPVFHDFPLVGGFTTMDDSILGRPGQRLPGYGQLALWQPFDADPTAPHVPAAVVLVGAPDFAAGDPPHSVRGVGAPKAVTEPIWVETNADTTGSFEFLTVTGDGVWFSVWNQPAHDVAGDPIAVAGSLRLLGSVVTSTFTGGYTVQVALAPLTASSWVVVEQLWFDFNPLFVVGWTVGGVAAAARRTRVWTVTVDPVALTPTLSLRLTSDTDTLGVGSGMDVAGPVAVAARDAATALVALSGATRPRAYESDGTPIPEDVGVGLVNLTTGAAHFATADQGVPVVDWTTGGASVAVRSLDVAVLTGTLGVLVEERSPSGVRVIRLGIGGTTPTVGPHLDLSLPSSLGWTGVKCRAQDDHTVLVLMSNDDGLGRGWAVDVAAMTAVGPFALPLTALRDVDGRGKVWGFDQFNSYGGTPAGEGFAYRVMAELLPGGLAVGTLCVPATDPDHDVRDLIAGSAGSDVALLVRPAAGEVPGVTFGHSNYQAFVLLDGIDGIAETVDPASHHAVLGPLPSFDISFHPPSPVVGEWQFDDPHARAATDGPLHLAAMVLTARAPTDRGEVFTPWLLPVRVIRRGAGWTIGHIPMRAT